MSSFKNWVPAILVMSLIFLMSSTTGQTIQAVGFDKPVIQVNGHLIAFFFLCIAFYKATKDILVSMIFTVFYGVLDEIHQLFTMWRNPSLFDIFVDACAAVVAGFILWKLQLILPKTVKEWLNS